MQGCPFRFASMHTRFPAIRFQGIKRASFLDLKESRTMLAPLSSFQHSLLLPRSTCTEHPYRPKPAYRSLSVFSDSNARSYARISSALCSCVMILLVRSLSTCMVNIGCISRLQGQQVMLQFPVLLTARGGSGNFPRVDPCLWD
jgi:hypothetical protein